MTTKKGRTKSRGAQKNSKLQPLQRFALFFFQRPRLTAIIALAVFGFGLLSYTRLLTREGFPAINIPYAIAQGTYLANDASKVDSEVTQPLSEYLASQSDIASVNATALGNFYTVVVEYEEGVDSEARTAELSANIDEAGILPDTATLNFDAARFGVTQRGDDAVLSFFSVKNPDSATTELVDPAQAAVEFLQDYAFTTVDEISLISPVESAQNPLTGQTQLSQTRFERYATREADSSETEFYNAIAIGATIKDGADTLEFDDELHAAASAFNARYSEEGYQLAVTAGFAPSIRQQISELQRTLLEGLIAVLLVGSIVIAVRASFITVVSMLMVIFATLGLLELIGYTLNTITLFSLILGLSLIVDDTIIMVEALDLQRRRKNDPDEIVTTATKKVGRAMIAATSTAALSFAPLLFVGGIIGTFVRAIPVTIMSALFISLIVALVFIPFMARFFLINKKHSGKKAEKEIASNFEAKVARFLSAPMLWAEHSRKRITLVGSSALLISFLFIGASGYLATRVQFNIFPPSNDTNSIAVTLTYPAGTTIDQAEVIADEAERRIDAVLGDSLEQVTNNGMATAQQARFTVDLVDYTQRDVSAPDYVDLIKADFEDFDAATVSAATIDAGPPAGAFAVTIASDDNPDGANRLANDIVTFLDTTELTRVSGEVVEIDSVAVDAPDAIQRADAKAFVGVSATFVDTDTSALVTIAQTAVEEEFTPEKVTSYGLDKDAMQFDFGSESQNQDSFRTMIIAFPVLLLVIYVLLALQFRSFLQPLLIFMAIPFSLLGVTLGLYLTNNPFSFFAMLGFFALIGLSIKNTILLTDYANQARRDGMGPVAAAHEALAERFRPLIATSLTAIVSLIPLAVTSPFWQGLAVVLMFGLLSSTFLVVTVFPYYYLGGEALRAFGHKYVGLPVRRALRRR